MATGAAAGLAAGLELVAGHDEGTEWALFAVAFGLLLPAAVAVVWMLAGRPGKGPGADRLGAFAALSGLALAAVLLAARIADWLGAEAGAAILLALVAAWAVFTAAAAVQLRRRQPRSFPRWTRERPGAWVATALVPVAVLAFIGERLPDASTLLPSVALGAAFCVLYMTLRSRLALSPRAVLALDVGAVLAILLLVSDVSVYTSAEATEPDSELTGGSLAGWLPTHHNPFLGPANDVLHGRAVLVDTYSQYGVGNIYFLAGLFELVPIGYGTMGLLVAAGLALQYALGYAAVRIAGVSPFLAAIALGAAIVASVFHSIGAPSAFPSLGAQRWLFAYAVILLAVIAARRPDRAPALRGASIALLAVSAVWSFEAFVFSAATFATATAYEAAVSEGSGGQRLRRLGRWWGLAALGCLAAWTILALGTLAAAGELPDLSGYVALLSAYGVESLGGVLAAPWWPGIFFAGFLFASAVVLLAVAAFRPGFEAANRPAMVAVATLTAFAIANFTYLVRVSWDDPVLRSILPALLLGALWIHLAERAGEAIPRVVRTATAALGLWFAALLVVQGWEDLTDRADRSPLVKALPRIGGSISEDLSRTWENPPLDPRAAAAERLLDAHWAGESRALVLLHPELGPEALIRSGRANLLPIDYLLQAEQAREETADRLVPALENLEAGTLMLTERFYLTPGARRDYIVEDSEALPLEKLVLRRIRQRFRLEPLASAPPDLVVVRLTPRGVAARKA